MPVYSVAAFPIAVGCVFTLCATSLPVLGQSTGQSANPGWVTQIKPTAPSTPAEPGASRPVIKREPGVQYLGVSSGKPGNTANGQQASGDRVNVNDLFRSAPQYGPEYQSADQIKIYGEKVAVEPPRPPIEIGRQQYTSGAYDQESTIFGALNPLQTGLAVYGDWRTAIAFNKNNGKEVAQVATRLNIDVDLKLTGTERIHAFFTPPSRTTHSLPATNLVVLMATTNSTVSMISNLKRFSLKATLVRFTLASPALNPVLTCPSRLASFRCSYRTGLGPMMPSWVAP